jgi:hypothetical protein
MIAPAVLTVALLYTAAVQPGAAGVWRAEYKTSNGRSHVFTLTLKANDRTLSGTISSSRGSVAITEGTVDGRDVSFTVTRRANYDAIDITYKGSIDGDVMRLTMRAGAREPIAVTARREAPAPPARNGRTP